MSGVFVGLHVQGMMMIMMMMMAIKMTSMMTNYYNGQMIEILILLVSTA